MASPMWTSSKLSMGKRASVSQAAIQGKSSQSRQALSSGKIAGESSSESFRMTVWGHASIQSPHFVHRSRNSWSVTAPGGRNHQVFTAGRDASSFLIVGASRCFTNSWTVAPMETNECRIKDLRPKAGSPSDVLCWSDLSIV